MSYEFEQFCLAHCCAISCSDRSDYCPIADAVREKYGKIDGTHCEKEFDKLFPLIEDDLTVNVCDEK